MNRGLNNNLTEETWEGIKRFPKYQISNFANFRLNFKRRDKRSGKFLYLKIFVFYTNYSKYGAVILDNEKFLVESIYRDTFKLEMEDVINKGIGVFIPKPEDKHFDIRQNVRNVKEEFLYNENRDVNRKALNFGVSKYYYDNGNLAKETEWKDKKINGFIKTYYKSGKLKSQIEFKNGKQIKEKITWDENGDLKNGFIQSFYKNGILSNLETFKEGKLHGINKSWYENGLLKYEVKYLEGKREGLQILYNDLGYVEMEANFKNEKLNGVSKGWIYNLEEQRSIIEHLITYKEGKQHGLYQKWHDNGALKEESKYYEGKQQGICKYYDKKGNIIRND